jgi:hypothetical protein
VRTYVSPCQLASTTGPADRRLSKKEPTSWSKARSTERSMAAARTAAVRMGVVRMGVVRMGVVRMVSMCSCLLDDATG